MQGGRFVPGALAGVGDRFGLGFCLLLLPFQFLELFPEGLELFPCLEDGGGPGLFRRFAARQLVPQPLLFQKGVGPLVFMDGDLRFPGGNPVLEVFPDLAVLLALREAVPGLVIRLLDLLFQPVGLVFQPLVLAPGDEAAVFLLFEVFPEFLQL